jgi:hypothetical protein
MIPLILALATARGADSTPPTIDRYECTQTNPMQYAYFDLHFRAIDRLSDPDRPVAARLDDLESDTLRVRSTQMARRPDYRDPGFIAYEMGFDDVGTEYLLYLPVSDLGDHPDVYVKQLFGGGRAQWIDEFTCDLMP